MIHSLGELEGLGVEQQAAWGEEAARLARWLQAGQAVPRGLLLAPAFLQAWLRAGGVQERLFLVLDRLPPQPEPLELWDLWLELQALLLRCRIPEHLEEPLGRRVQELGGAGFRVWASLPAGSLLTLQREFPGIRGTAAVLEAVRLAWAAVLCAVPNAAAFHEVAGAVVVESEEPGATGTARESGAPATSPAGAARRTAPIGPAPPAPDASLLRLAELHGRLLLPDLPRRFQALLDLGPWAPFSPGRATRGAGGRGAHAQSFRRPFPPAIDTAEEEELLRAADAAGLSGTAELLGRARASWIAWVDAYAAAPPLPAVPKEGTFAGDGETAGRGEPPAAAGAGGRPGHRQLAGNPAAPGLAAGPARVLRTPEAPVVRPGEVLVCRTLTPALSAAALAAAALVLEQGGRLGYGPVLAARAGIPCVCGARAAVAHIRDGDALFVDGQLGIVSIKPVR